ncbi:MAG TPA: SDR family oxidoreductase, partial [Opitutaceae bacterium]|nr:SDR family oxidoreductase [Opitutaceae bacterium]
IGSKVVKSLLAQGHKVIAASPSQGVNTLTGEGLAEAMVDAQVVIDLSNSPSFEDKAVMSFFETAGRNLLAAEAAAGVRHHVALSVVGTDRLQSSGYFRAKLVQEALIKASPIPFSIVRATQFFEFLNAVAHGATQDNIIKLPSALMQPVYSSDVADTMVDVATSAPLNATVELAGPEAYPLDQLIRLFLKSHQDTRSVITDEKAGYFGSPIQRDTLIPGANSRLGQTRLLDWLSRTASAAR